ncbi:MAG: SLC5 family protein [Henriciella sp.]|nr:SLC5 family protein [Henriciella sp.]
MDSLQIGIFLFITALIGFLTYLGCRNAPAGDRGSDKDYFLANGGLSWYFVAGSITLTNLSTDQLVGMNGNQMLLLAWWELAAVVGLLVLAFVFLPIYYRNNCTTTTELLQRKYDNKHIRALISVLFLLGNLFIFLPAILYGGSLFLKSTTGADFSGLFGERLFTDLFVAIDPVTQAVIPEKSGVDATILLMSIAFAIIGALYAILGGLRAVAISDTYSGVLILSLALLVVFLAMQAIGWDLSNVPAERLDMLQGDTMVLDGKVEENPIPWHTLLTGMIFIQIFYWSTNQTITQRAMASPTIAEARKGVLAAAGIRLLIVPVIVVLPGVVAYELYGDVGDEAYGMIVGDLLPPILSGAFAAAIAAAVLTTFNSILNASAALYVCDIHESYIEEARNVPKLSLYVSVVMTVLAITLVPIFASQESIINTVQQLYGLLSMPILSAFIVGLVFRNVSAWAAIIGVVAGVFVYAVSSFELYAWSPKLFGIKLYNGLPLDEGLGLALSGIHYIHYMFVTLFVSIGVALLANLIVFGRKASLSFRAT